MTENLPPLRDVIEAYGLNAKKSLGQNFLLDLNLTGKIARAAGSLKGINVIEIGPGPGGLTRALVEGDAASVTAIEYDDRCIDALQSLVAAAGGKLTLIKADALKTDVTALVSAPRAVVANLPYNIATVLLINWLRQIDEFKHLTLMFQREVAERIVAAPSTPAYGRLSIISQWLTTPDILFDINPRAFTPAPKVVSSVVHFVPKTTDHSGVKFATMEKLTAAAFGQRRKMLRKSLQQLPIPVMEVLAEAGITETRRAEEISPQGFVELAAIVQRYL